jgi:hypothetical protein
MGCQASIIAFAEFVSHEARPEGVYATASTEHCDTPRGWVCVAFRND